MEGRKGWGSVGTGRGVSYGGTYERPDTISAWAGRAEGGYGVCCAALNNLRLP